MRLIIVSDSHGNSTILDEIASRYSDSVDGFVHCGDSELSSTNLIWDIMDTVAGNCDFDPNFPDIFLNDSLDAPYLIVHGHRHQVKYTLQYLKEEAKKEQVAFVFYGHSHVLTLNDEDGIFLINPGSIQQPRGELKERTYGLLETSDETVSFRVFNHQHQELPEHSQLWRL